MGNYVCLSCLGIVHCFGIFHGKCLNRIKEFVELDEGKLYCSTKCNKEANGKQFDINNLYEELNRLKQLLKENSDRSQIMLSDHNTHTEIYHDGW